MIRIFQGSGAKPIEVTPGEIRLGVEADGSVIETIDLLGSELTFHPPFNVGDYTIRESVEGCGAHILEETSEGGLTIRQDSTCQEKDEKLLFLSCAINRETECFGDDIAEGMSVKILWEMCDEGTEYRLLLARQERPYGFFALPIQWRFKTVAEDRFLLLSWERNIEVVPETSCAKLLRKLRHQAAMARLEEMLVPYEIAKDADHWVKIYGDHVTIRRYNPKSGSFSRDYYTLSEDGLAYLEAELPKYEQLYQLYQSEKAST